VADRIAQTVVALALEARTESIFHDDSYGYRPGRSALQAVERCRTRCWKKDWVLDLDVQKFFDSVDHSLMVKAVEANTDKRWVVLYVKRWLVAPLALPDGTLQARDRGTPQGSLCSAEHKDPYEQCWVMRSVGLFGLVEAVSGVERCA
jgi:RNA-directed DNA polymerase